MCVELVQYCSNGFVMEYLYIDLYGTFCMDRWTSDNNLPPYVIGDISELLINSYWYDTYKSPYNVLYTENVTGTSGTRYTWPGDVLVNVIWSYIE